MCILTKVCFDRINAGLTDLNMTIEFDWYDQIDQLESPTHVKLEIQLGD